MTVALRGLRPRGLAWSVLTTHRVALRVWAGFVVLTAACLVAAYVLGEDLRAALAVCGHGFVPCSEEVHQQEITYARLLETVSDGLLCTPMVVAAFAGASLTGREMETGTARLAWTQSVSPARWLAAKLAVPAVLLTGGMLVLTLLHRWVRGSGHLAGQGGWDWPHLFTVTGPAGTAYVLFGLVAGALAGLLVRRQLAALAVGAVVTVPVQILGFLSRPHLWPAETARGATELNRVSQPMPVDAGLLTPSGEQFSIDRCFAGGPSPGVEGCIEKYDLEQYLVHHPASHYWPLQLVETGILLALAALLAATAFRLIRRRTV